MKRISIFIPAISSVDEDIEAGSFVPITIPVLTLSAGVHGTENLPGMHCRKSIK